VLQVLQKKPSSACTTEKCRQAVCLEGDQYRLDDSRTLLYSLILDTSNHKELDPYIKNYCPKKSLTRFKKRRAEFNHQIRLERKLLIKTVIGKLHDLRPYAQVTLLGKTDMGLLDTGASVCCIGGSLAKDLINTTAYKRLSASVKTADGKSQGIVGRKTADVSR